MRLVIALALPRAVQLAVQPAQGRRMADYASYMEEQATAALYAAHQGGSVSELRKHRALIEKGRIQHPCSRLLRRWLSFRSREALPLDYENESR